MSALGSRSEPYVARRGPYSSDAGSGVPRARPVRIAPSEPCAGSRAGCALRGSRQSASATAFKGGCVGQGLGVRPELPCMRPRHTPAPRRALRGTGEAGDAHLAPRERSHHGRDRSMPSSVSFGASKECGGRKSPNALYRIEHGRNELGFIISRKQIKSERKLPVGESR